MQQNETAFDPEKIKEIYTAFFHLVNYLYLLLEEPTYTVWLNLFK